MTDKQYTSYISLKHLTPTSSIAASTHSVIRAASTHHVVTATTRWPVIGARSLHAHGLPLGFIMGSHLRAATLEDLNVPESIEMARSRHGEWIETAFAQY